MVTPTTSESIAKIDMSDSISLIIDFNPVIDEQELIEIDELSAILNSENFSSESLAKATDFCGSYNQIKRYIGPIISLLRRASKIRLLSRSWRRALANAAQVIELLQQFCDRTCP